MKNDNTNLIISVHIYKTAGSTFHTIIDRNYKQEEIIYANLEGVNKIEKMLKEDSYKRKDKTRIVHGHFPFGWHSYFNRSYKYISFLREPTERVISDYYYNRNFEFGHNHFYAKRMSLEEYISCPELLDMDNGQTRFISGDFKTPFGELGESTLLKAKENIEKYFAFIGLTEKFNESLILCSYILGWNKVYYSNKNVTPKKDKYIDNKLLEKIHERNLFDLQLYSFVKDCFDVELSKVPVFSMRIALLRSLNFSFNKLHPIYLRIKNVKKHS